MDEIDIESAINDVDIDNDEEVQLSLPEIIQLMEENWLNEKFSPEILPNRMDIVELLLDQITTLENNLKKLSNADFKKGLYQMEVDRIRFLISSYLRKRLEKIETYSTVILEQEKSRVQQGSETYLSQNELEFAQEYDQSIREHFESIMRFCPGITETQLINPNLHTMVFLKSKEDIEGIVIDDGNDENDLIDLNKGSQVLISYKSVNNFVKSGNVHLI
ncbi:DNA replication complex GINS protein Sld5 isoform X2 [Rhynchophorus ferrugineus]|uniref:DNA replication complex GINS protein Sld5 isoform X2 n=1 Tax=Rhynchophorus ferrugineus TaxID=354439 RepID=UPI003FCD531F